MTKLRIIILSLFFLACAGVSLASSGPMAQAQGTIDKVVQILKTADLDTEVRREMLSQELAERFDFRAMSQRVLAVNWKKASPQEREKFTALFSELLKRNYIGHIEAYTDEKVEFVKERIKKNKASIDTLIITKSAEIPVSYRMAQQGEEWKVYDVVIEKVSFVNNYRSTYGQLIKKGGFSGLLAKMEEKLQQLKEES